LSDSAVVIVATVGKPTLARTIESILNQTHENTTCLVVVDGPEFAENAMGIVAAVEYETGQRVQVVTLPQNTGANGFVCHRIYGAMPMLVNQDFIFYCDDDNWYDPNHVRNCVKACVENELDWCFALRNVYHEGEFLCRDECESVGLWPVWYNDDFAHIDTNCFCLRRDVAVSLAPRWHKSRIVDGKTQPSADTQIANYLRKNRPNHALVPEFTVNYELGSWALSPKPAFFLDGNVKFAEKHGGVMPWEVAK
jgi:glycosyltransferase involved in cell wall biosynthesis